MGWHDFERSGVVSSIGEAESRRFGLRVLNVRAGVGSEGAAELRMVLQSERFDLAVVRYPAEALELGEVLSSLDKTLIPTDPLVYWGSAQLAPAVGPERNEQFVRVGESSLDVLVDIIFSSFNGYRSHWHHNSMTRSINMVDAYTEWTEAVIRNERHGAFLLHASDGDEPIGMALTELNDGVVEILLAGVVPEYQAKGHYGAILNGVEQYARSESCARVVISTQASNYRVQRAWSRHGWIPLRALQNVHVRGPNVK